MVGAYFTLYVLLFGFVLSEVPDYIHICHKKDPNVVACIKESIEHLKPKLAEGLPEIDAPGIDPFLLDKVTIFQGSEKSGLYAYLENLQVRGAGDFEITKLKLDIDKMTYRVGVTIPFLDIVGAYNINLKILQNPIKENGDFHANVSGINGQAVIQGELEENHLMFKSFNFKIGVKDFNVDFGDLFKSNPALNELAKDLINNNKGDLIKMALPFIERKVAEILLETSNKITKNLDYNEVFPE
ncbi:putative beta-carotene-binding protein [Sitophilus oryzae]|uniref:Beta-carotene-binding protein n=1 Tax=Sitophilus oryzae TaxID=7048 RepID=A0A6J2YV32_SITOR|nr:putative beta-carotene-binding protein [Sitophilus oryzae]